MKNNDHSQYLLVRHTQLENNIYCIGTNIVLDSVISWKNNTVNIPTALVNATPRGHHGGQVAMKIFVDDFKYKN
jgi:hypothetical protein